MVLAYTINRNGSISIENVDVLQNKYGRYTTYYFCTLAQAKRMHRESNDLKNVKITWLKI